MTTAEQIRADRDELRDAIGAGEITAAEVMADWRLCIHGCGAYVFLSYIDGPQLAFVLLRRANCIQVGHKRLDQLTPRQRERLTRVVRDYEQGRHPAERGIS